MNEAEATRIVGMFLSAFPSSNADDGTVNLWVDALSTVTELDGRRAAAEYIKTGKFFPSIAEVRDILGSFRRQQMMVDGGRSIGYGTVMDAKEGMQVAKRAYLAECRLQGREPTPKIVAGFDSGYLGGVKADAS